MHAKVTALPRPISDAAETVSAIALLEAADVRRRVGFTFQLTTDAPETFEALRMHWRASLSTGQPLPVSSLHCDRTIFRREHINHVVRFWHDSLHVELDAGFSLTGEQAVAERQQQVIGGIYGLPENSLVRRLMWVDSFGQALCAERIGHFPADQRRFDLRALIYGLDEAIRLESVEHTTRKEA